jgi:hypothetical protein
MNWPAQSPTSISKPICHDSSNWATRAEELRQLAANMKVVGAQTIMLRLAADYDRLAENAESYVTKTP